ncbi:MAG: alpha/beta fold hydrolase [Deltaproteobacteria bacterium]|nr:alpha/beta fold hydrolase [Deltaproteobacteria bacterium]
MHFSRSKPEPSVLPKSTKAAFSFPSSGSENGEGVMSQILLLHGFTSTPFEVRFFGEALAQDGYGSFGPLLAGHGEEDPSELGRVTWEEWMDQSRAAFTDLPVGLEKKQKRFVVGSSMGGLLALLLAAEFPVDGLILLSPALLMTTPGEVGALVMRSPFRKQMKVVEKKEHGGDIFDEEGKDSNPTYTQIDPKGLHQMDLLRHVTMKHLPDVTCPLLIFQGAHDRTVAQRAVRVIGEKVQSDLVTTVFLPHSRHILGLDVERDVILQNTRQFVLDVENA